MTKATWTRPPADLDERARNYWQFYASGLIDAGRLTAGRVHRFKLLCNLLAICDRCAVELGRDGVTTKSNTGVLKSHPAASVFLQAQREARALLREFGLG